MTQDFPPIVFAITCSYHGNTLSATVENASCTSTNICPKFHEDRSKTEEVVHDAGFSPCVPIICRYHGNTLPHPHPHGWKCVLHILHIKANMLTKFPSKYFWNALFFTTFFNVVTMAAHILPLSKNVSCTFTPQGKHLCKFHENWWKTKEV